MKSFAIVAAALAGIAFGQKLPTPEMFPIERYFQYPLLNGRSPASPSLSPDGKTVVFGWNRTGERRLDLWSMDLPSGERRMVVEAAKIPDLPRQDDTRTQQEKDEAKLYDGGISGATWSPDSKEFLFSYKGRTFRMERGANYYTPIFDGSSGAGGYQYTNDGKYYVYLKGSNLYRMDRKSGQEKQLTFLSKANTSIDGFTISDDSKLIAIDWSDSSRLGSHVMMDFSKDRATVVNIRRNWQGEKSNDGQVGVVGIEGGIVRWVPDIPRYNWGKGIEFSPDSKTLAIAWYKEDFQEFTISTVDPVSLKKTDLYKEKAPSNYCTDFRPMSWTRDSKSILLGTDILDAKWAYRSVVKIDRESGKVERVYAEPHDVGAMARPKDSDRLILVTAKHSPLKTEITVVEPNGEKTEHVVMPNGYSSPKDFNAAISPMVSDDGKTILTMASDRTVNAELYLVEPKLRRLTESQLPEFSKVKWADMKEVTFQAPDGKTVHALLITKPGIDISIKRPAVISNIYADSGKMAWAGYVENYLAMELGYAVLCVDFRSSWGSGGELNSGYYKKMGLVDADEAVAAKNYLASLPYVNGDRVGIWGWSYGGYLTCMTMLTKPGVFDTGVAVASVTDWKSYNEWYTRRRLGQAAEDDETYKKTSPISYASGLQGNLLLVHGILDDNVLFQDTARLMQRMIDAGRYFDLMAYPRDDHSIGKDTSRPHVFANIVRYLYGKLSRQ